MLRARLFRRQGPPVDLDLAAWPPLRGDNENSLWMDGQDATEDELRLLAGAAAVDLAPIHARQLADREPILQAHDEQASLSVSAVNLEQRESVPHVHLQPVDVLVGRNVMITIHAGPLAFGEALQARLGGDGYLGWYDSAYLLHVFLDTLLDHYGRVFEDFERRSDRLEDRLLREPGRGALGDMLVLKRRVIGFRRLVGALDEPLTTLVAPDSPSIAATGLISARSTR